MFSKAKVGDMVWHHTHNCYKRVNGVDIDSILVGCVWCNFDGKNGAGAQILFWDKPSIVAPSMPPRKVKRWIRGQYNENGEVFISGNGIYPTLFKTQEEASVNLLFPLPIAFILEVEIEERWPYLKGSS